MKPKIEIGQNYKADFGGRQQFKIHICAIVDDDMIVYKYYRKRKQWWHYEVKHRELLEMLIKNASENK